MIEESWDKHHGQLCVDLNWELFPSKEDAKVWRPLPNWCVCRPLPNIGAFCRTSVHVWGVVFSARYASCSVSSTDKVWEDYQTWYSGIQLPGHVRPLQIIVLFLIPLWFPPASTYCIAKYTAWSSMDPIDLWPVTASSKSLELFCSVLFHGKFIAFTMF